MSSSEGPKAQKRPIDVHAMHGQRLTKVCFPNSNDLDLRQTYPTPRRIDQPAVPTAENLPVEPAKAKTMTVHQHIPYEGPTAYPMPRGRSRQGNRTTTDTVITTVTKVVGKEKRTDAKRWKTPKQTKKTQAVKRRANKWLAKYG